MGVHRRSVLVGVAATLTGFAGCTGGGGSAGGPGPPTADRPGTSALRIVDFDTAAAEDGSLVVWVVVENQTDARRSATLTLSIRAGDTRETQSVPVTVGAGERTREEVVFDIPAEEFEADGNINLRLE